MQDAMHDEAEATDQSLYVRFVEKSTGRGDCTLAEGAVEFYEAYMHSASGELASDYTRTMTTPYGYKQSLMDAAVV
jgi:hypothetical protein